MVHLQGMWAVSSGGKAEEGGKRQLRTGFPFLDSADIPADRDDTGRVSPAQRSKCQREHGLGRTLWALRMMICNEGSLCIGRKPVAFSASVPSLRRVRVAWSRLAPFCAGRTAAQSL